MQSALFPSINTFFLLQCNKLFSYHETVGALSVCISSVKKRKRKIMQPESADLLIRKIMYTHFQDITYGGRIENSIIYAVFSWFVGYRIKYSL